MHVWCMFSCLTHGWMFNACWVDSDGCFSIFNGFGWIPIAWIGVGEETWSFSLEVGDGWMFGATPKFCVENWKPRTDTLDLGWPESCLPWLSCPLAIGFVGLWGRRPFVTSPSAPKVGLSQVTASHLELASETIVMTCYELRWIQQVAMGKRLVYSYVVSMDLKWWPIDPSWSIPTSIVSHSYHIFFDG